MRRMQKRRGALIKLQGGRNGLEWAGGGLARPEIFNRNDEGGEKRSLIQRHTAFPFILLQFCRLCPLSSFTFTLHPAGVDLVASDEWRGSDAVYGIGLRGLGVSAVCKVASTVWYNMAGLLATKLVAAVVLRPFMGCEPASYIQTYMQSRIIGSKTSRNQC